MPRKLKPLITFIQDTREQAPFHFAAPVRREFADGGTRVATLNAGDYSVCLDDSEILSVAIERKSLGDFYGVCGWGRERFERELERLTQYDYRAIIIEASADAVLRGFERSQITGRSAMASLCCWSVRFGIPVWFGETHRRAGGMCQRLLEEFAVHHLRAGRENEKWREQVQANGGNSTTA